MKIKSDTNDVYYSKLGCDQMCIRISYLFVHGTVSVTIFSNIFQLITMNNLFCNYDNEYLKNSCFLLI